MGPLAGVRARITEMIVRRLEPLAAPAIMGTRRPHWGLPCTTATHFALQLASPSQAPFNGRRMASGSIVPPKRRRWGWAARWPASRSSAKDWRTYLFAPPHEAEAVRHERPAQLSDEPAQRGSPAPPCNRRGKIVAAVVGSRTARARSSRNAAGSGASCWNTLPDVQAGPPRHDGGSKFARALTCPISLGAGLAARH